MSIPKGVPLGARVEYIGNNPEIKGEEGTIIKFWTDCVLVEFDNPIPYGHDGRSVGGWCGKDGHCRWFPLENEGLVVKSMPHDETMGELMEKFKKGDRVVVVKPPLTTIKEGARGTVLYDKDSWGDYGVALDEAFERGHALGGACEPGHGYWFCPGQLEHLGTDVMTVDALLFG